MNGHRRLCRYFTCASLVVLILSGCAPWSTLALPNPLSRPAAPESTSVLRAGFGYADITPPPGPGLMGYGPEANLSRGWRTRLGARALVIEDADGERLGLVVAELGQLSPLLHREVAARIVRSTGIGADRLIISATHTHGGPGNHFGFFAYDHLGTNLGGGGFDPGMVDFLAARIAAAIQEADSALAPARVAWGERSLPGLTRNRSDAAFAQNGEYWNGRFPGVDGAGMHVDPRLLLLRVELQQAGGVYRPAGAFAIFAVHGTGIPAANELFDADIHGLAARRLEDHIDAVNGRSPTFRPAAVALLANSAEGDVSPNLPETTRCALPSLERVQRPSGPRTPPGPELWIPPPAAQQSECLTHARAASDQLAENLGTAMVQLYDSVAGQTSDQFRVRRVFATIRLEPSRQFPGICAPQPGTATIAGAEDGPTRYRGWEFLGVFAAGFQEDSTAVRQSDHCRGAKRPFLGRLYRPLTSVFPVPRLAQLTLAQLGPVLLAALPYEATTVTGAMIEDAVLAAAPPGGFRGSRVIGLANGYNQYVASAAEYSVQHYEGASTLAGPETARFLAEAFGELTQRLPIANEPSPPATVPVVTVHPGPRIRAFPPPDAGPRPEDVKREAWGAWEGDELVVRWTDVAPGRLIPADGPVLRIDALTAAGTWQPLVWDGSPRLSIQVLDEERQGATVWEARSVPDQNPGVRLRLVLLERPGLEEVELLLPPP